MQMRLSHASRGIFQVQLIKKGLGWGMCDVSYM